MFWRQRSDKAVEEITSLSALVLMEETAEKAGSACLVLLDMYNLTQVSITVGSGGGGGANKGNSTDSAPKGSNGGDTIIKNSSGTALLTVHGGGSDKCVTNSSTFISVLYETYGADGGAGNYDSEGVWISGNEAKGDPGGNLDSNTDLTSQILATNPKIATSERGYGSGAWNSGSSYSAGGGGGGASLLSPTYGTGGQGGWANHSLGASSKKGKDGQSGGWVLLKNQY